MKLSLEQIAYPWGIRRVAHLKAIERDARSQHEILFDLVGEASLPVPEVLDGFVMGVIFYAMRIGEDIHVEGPVSQDAMSNLLGFQEAWEAWRPKVYRRVAIRAEEVVQSVSAHETPRAISAFSGGIDSCFTLLRHSSRMLGDRFYPLDSVLMVQGFDIPVEQPDTFEALTNRVRPMLEELGVGRRIVRTNLRALGLQDWEDSHMAQLAACLHNFSSEFRYALVGSSKPYADLHIPYGSNPITDPMLSGSAMRLIHDGAGSCRTAKAAMLARFPVVRRAVKVCWEGAEQSRNCGTCEKCVRTQVNFLAAGCDQPEGFERPLDENLIKTVTFIGQSQFLEWKHIVAFAEERGVRGRWLTLARRRMAAHRLKTPADAFWFAEFKLLRGFAKLARWWRKRTFGS